MLIGLIADTHGTIDSRVRPVFEGVGLILHAGDIGSEQVLAWLAEMASVTAVAGNNDLHLAHLGLPLHADVVLDGVHIHLVHRLQDAQPLSETNVVVYGHSHKALVAERDSRLYVNPGAAGRVGFHREITLGLLRVDGKECRAEIVSLGPRSSALDASVRS
jgi:putative phosphoesterase